MGRWGGPTAPGPVSRECADRAQAGSCHLPLREATAAGFDARPTFQIAKLRLICQGRDHNTERLRDLPEISLPLLRGAQTQTQGF